MATLVVIPTTVVGPAGLEPGPALLLSGTMDFGFRDKERRRFENAFVNERTVLLDAGYFWQEDQPDIAVTEIHRWITDTCPKQPDEGCKNLSIRNHSAEHLLRTAESITDSSRSDRDVEPPSSQQPQTQPALPDH